MKKIVIIGGGIAGASAAYYLSGKNCHVTLVDRQDFGQATGAAAGIICPWLSQRRNKKWYFLVKEGAAYYPELIRALKEDGEEDTGYKITGGIALHREEEKRNKMYERALKKREDAPEMGDVTSINAEQVNQLFPYLTEDFYGLHVSGAARVDGRKLRQALINGLKKNGGRLLTGEAELITEAGEVSGVRAAGEKLQAESVVVAAGAWAPAIFEKQGVDIDVSYQKAQIVHLGIENESKHLPVVMPPGDQYLLSFDDHRIVAGTTHENDRPMDDQVTMGGLNEIFQKTISIASDLESAAFLEARVGYRPFTPGFLPVAGPFPEMKGVFFINGLGSSGLTSGPFIGREVAKMAINEPSLINPEDYPVKNIIR
ncbi:NAD(P)/FAD-dependent oxidoreductase [Jeotgalibacillus terrae]|uniref:NAD(P)/FAD-dependent oxidoreductase n=1 Tax=Jeotgalibacillus terrae TaxID=587735 RepID=A0ABW5ZGQ1_9BACL|nr:FAD-dependent oxidoreductase [Jeotgalibacillus terrae]MBM7578266.1 D-amino-acid dehydrogenase [Jeotgalibacillus terrae]